MFETDQQLVAGSSIIPQENAPTTSTTQLIIAIISGLEKNPDTLTIQTLSNVASTQPTFALGSMQQSTTLETDQPSAALGSAQPSTALGSAQQTTAQIVMQPIHASSGVIPKQGI